MAAIAHRVGPAGIALAALLACTPQPRGEAATPAMARAAPVQRAIAPKPALEALSLLTDPTALAALSERGADFGALAIGEHDSGLDNARLAEAPAYRSLMEPVERDLAALIARDPQAGVSVRGHAHRVFDARWLRAAGARFELVAVSNRIDRRALGRGRCGELRLIYRLAYAQQRDRQLRRSRLPMTLVIELDAEQAGGDCAAAAARWMMPAGASPTEIASRLLADDGPLARTRLTRERLVQLAVNVQAVRWPSAVRPELGGHAEYSLRAFEFDDASVRYRPRKLENTPDVARLTRDRDAKARLLAWLRAPEQRAAIDGGFVRMPDEFLAETAVSVTPRGFARRANRPFRQLFAPDSFADLPLSSLRFARSPEAFVRRLDDLSCQGCHQARSIAGFHLLGDEAPDAEPGNALALAISPHTHDDLARRQRYVRALAEGEAVDEARPFAERADDDAGAFGAHCGLGDSGFVAWTCAPSLRCDPFESGEDDSVGSCVHEVAAVGEACEPARVRANADAHADRVVRGPARACPGVCEATRVGFPSGMCATSCDGREEDVTCGGIAILTPFNECLARARPFAECATRHSRPAGLRACDEARPCRDDYLCTRTPGGGGACLPPYFVLQMRVDGHPAPVAQR